MSELLDGSWEAGVSYSEALEETELSDNGGTVAEEFLDAWRFCRSEELAKAKQVLGSMKVRGSVAARRGVLFCIAFGEAARME